MAFFGRSIDFMGIRNYAFAFSALVVVGSLAMLATRGLNYGLDFTGGTVVELRYQAAVAEESVRLQLEGCGFQGAVVQTFGSAQDLLVRMPPQDSQELKAIQMGPCAAKMSELAPAAVASPTVGQARASTEDNLGKIIQAALHAKTTTPFEVRRSEFVGPSVGAELREQGLLALMASMGLVLVYVLFRFTFRLAVGAIVALMHDPIVVLGYFALTQREFDLSVLAAILALIGYSINDSIVIADRIRENFRVVRGGTPADVVNFSLNQTLDRTIMTSFATALSMIALFLFGGELLRGFSIAMILGIAIGTYSSIYVSATLALMLGMTRDDLMVTPKEQFQDGRP